jgi:hypothetical protein
VPVKGYLRGVTALLNRSNKVIAQGSKQIDADFKMAFNDILGFIPALAVLSPDEVDGIIGATQARVDDLAVDFGITFQQTVQQQQQITDDLYKLYGKKVAPKLLIPTVGSDPELVAISSSLSQELIGSVTRRITDQAGRTLRLASLSPTTGGIAASNAVKEALGEYKAWSAKAQRIFTTESLRLASMASHQSYQALNEWSGGNVNRMWIWSQIQRPEHARISGQIRRGEELFDVPLREGGFIQMRYPRDPVAIGHPSATINCRCFVIPWAVGTPAPPIG